MPVPYTGEQAPEHLYAASNQAPGAPQLLPALVRELLNIL